MNFEGFWGFKLLMEVKHNLLQNLFHVSTWSILVYDGFLIWTKTVCYWVNDDKLHPSRWKSFTIF